MNDTGNLLERPNAEPLYLQYDFEDCVIRSAPGEGYYVKFKGAKEFKTKLGIVTEAKLKPPIHHQYSYYVALREILSRFVCYRSFQSLPIPYPPLAKAQENSSASKISA